MLFSAWAESPVQLGSAVALTSTQSAAGSRLGDLLSISLEEYDMYGLVGSIDTGALATIPSIEATSRTHTKRNDKQSE